MKKITKKQINATEMKNITLNDDGHLVIKCGPKVFIRKTLKGALAVAKRNQKTLTISFILTASTYPWSPGRNASTRRYNESRREGEVEGFVRSMKQLLNVDVSFYYSESCNHVYKSVDYKINDHKVNLTKVKTFAARHGITLEKE